MKVIIRKAREKELKIVQDLNHQLFVHDQKYDPLLVMDWPYEKEGADYFKSRISGEEGVCFVAEVDGEIVGYLAGGMIKPHSEQPVKRRSKLENTLVKETFRNQGIGKKLFNAFIKWSHAQGAERIIVTAYTGNVSAVRFYREVGFNDFATKLEYKIKP